MEAMASFEHGCLSLARSVIRGTLEVRRPHQGDYKYRGIDGQDVDRYRKSVMNSFESDRPSKLPLYHQRIHRRFKRAFEETQASSSLRVYMTCQYCFVDIQPVITTAVGPGLGGLGLSEIGGLLFPLRIVHGIAYDTSGFHTGQFTCQQKAYEHQPLVLGSFLREVQCSEAVGSHNM